VGSPNPFFKVGIVSLQIGLQIGMPWQRGEAQNKNFESKNNTTPIFVPL
jgi:hypothetical protein